MNYCSIGKLVATFGVGGELILQHHLGKKSSLKGLETVFIEGLKDEMLPYFIESAKIKSEDEVYLKLEDVHTKEAARPFVRKEIWLEESVFQKYAGKSAPISLLGFHIIDNGVDIGEILEVIEQPHQVLCRISLEGKDALIPVHEDTLQKLDKKKKQVLVELPDGLLDIFRGI
ncbi:MAG: 16S rRNA processing protein RimM [Chitinophagaceae bacterium]|nr:MAG: 16S rRNA processing protein RimM [Chitinophagaceae bacterium]